MPDLHTPVLVSNFARLLEVEGRPLSDAFQLAEWFHRLYGEQALQQAIEVLTRKHEEARA